jgi:succinyl-CoA synthetase alpha subunit
MCAIPGKVFGHAGAWAGPGEGSAQDKWTALEGAGAVMVDHPAKFGETMKRLLALPPSQKIEVSKSSSEMISSLQKTHRQDTFLGHRKGPFTLYGDAHISPFDLF